MVKTVTVDLEDFEFAVADRFPGVFGRSQRLTAATPRELIDQLASHASSPDDGPCLTVRAFYRIRRMLSQYLDRSPRGIVPTTCLTELMPDLEQRRSQWLAVHAAIGAKYGARLVRPEPLAWVIALTVGTLFLATISAAAIIFTTTWPILPVGAIAAALTTWAALQITSPWARHFEPRDFTVGDLARYAVAYNSPVLDAEYPVLTRSQIIEIVRALVRLEVGAVTMPLDATWRELVHVSRAR
jgi:hypothetical protein